MSDFQDLKERLALDLEPHLSRLDGVQIDEAVKEAIDHYTDERWWFLEATTTLTTVADQPNVDLPDDFERLVYLTVLISNQRWPVHMRSYDWYRDRAFQAATTTGRPFDAAGYAEKLWLWPTPDQAYSMPLDYIRRLDSATLEAGTQWSNALSNMIRARASGRIYAHILRDDASAAIMHTLEMGEYAKLKGRSEARRVAHNEVRPHYT